MRRFLLGAVSALGLVVALGGSASAGPIILDGTDSDDHGFASGGVNMNGWKYIQSGLQNLLPQVTNGNQAGQSIVVLGGTGSTAWAAITSAAAAVPGTPVPTFISSTTDIATFLTGGSVSGASMANTALLYIPSDGAGGFITPAQVAALTANAGGINAFVNGGGGLFSLGNSYTWLSALLPGIVITPGGSGNPISLTPAGNAAFPGLTNADLSTGPWHYDFSGNLGGLSVLFTSDVGGQNPIRNVGIGGGAGTSIVTQVPEPATMAVFGFGALVAGGVYRRNRKVTTA